MRNPTANRAEGCRGLSRSECIAHSNGESRRRLLGYLPVGAHCALLRLFAQRRLLGFLPIGVHCAFRLKSGFGSCSDNPSAGHYDGHVWNPRLCQAARIIIGRLSCEPDTNLTGEWREPSLNQRSSPPHLTGSDRSHDFRGAPAESISEPANWTKGNQSQKTFRTGCLEPRSGTT